MKENVNEPVYCLKVAYKKAEADALPTIIYGIIVKQDKQFLYVQTRNNIHIIRRDLILTIQTTQDEYHPPNEPITIPDIIGDYTPREEEQQ